MARGRAKKSAQKGKGKNKGPSSSPGKKMKSVDEVIGVQPIVVPSAIRDEQEGRRESLEIEMEKMTPRHRRKRSNSQKRKVMLSEWLN